MSVCVVRASDNVGVREYLVYYKHTFLYATDNIVNSRVVRLIDPVIFCTRCCAVYCVCIQSNGSSLSSAATGGAENPSTCKSSISVERMEMA